MSGEIKLRKFENGDAAKILSWIKDEKTFFYWNGEKYGDFPPKETEMISLYRENNPDGFIPVTAVFDGEVAGHFAFRFLNEEKTAVRLGFIVVDGSKRGKGYGRKMLEAALDYFFGDLKVKKVFLGVFEENAPARKCYESLGFEESKSVKPKTLYFKGEGKEYIELETDNHKNR